MKMNKKLIAGRFGKAMNSYNGEAIIQEQIATRMICLLERYRTAPGGKVIEVGCGTGHFSRMLFRSLQPRELLLNDICTDMHICLDGFLSEKVRFCPGDAEQLAFPSDQDLIVSCSVLQWFVSPERFFKRCHRFLSEGGLLAFSTFGKENMKEITSITGNSLPYRSKAELEQSLSADYHLVYSQEETMTLSFDSPLEVLHHLKRTGVTAMKETFWTKRDLRAFCERYTEQFSNGGSVCLTYHPIYIIVKKKNNEQ